MDELEKNEELGDLYAYYGSLLTPAQQNYFKEYYYDDLSLGEIATNHSVSRQAVFDNLKRSSRILQNYEAKLHLQHNDQQAESTLADALLAIDNHDSRAARKEILSLLNKMRGE